MRVGRSAAVFAAVLLLLGRVADADELSKAQSALAALRADLNNGRITRAEIFFRWYFITTPIPVTPESLEAGAEKKLSVEMNAELIKDLIQAIDGTQLHLDSERPDLRWGAVFFNKSGMRLHSIYLNSWYRHLGAGRSGSIGGVNVQLNRSLIVWFETNFGTKWDVHPSPPG